MCNAFSKLKPGSSVFVLRLFQYCVLKKNGGLKSWGLTIGCSWVNSDLKLICWEDFVEFYETRSLL